MARTRLVATLVAELECAHAVVTAKYVHASVALAIA
jgi:hypothetical protein